jgi:hypothetical protein
MMAFFCQSSLQKKHKKCEKVKFPAKKISSRSQAADFLKQISSEEKVKGNLQPKISQLFAPN